ncbi:MAG: HAD-IIB family hydrolase, partial [Planctomycetes bacterium]|nr:HAD-IIB family hydrolase [Planctomycetota bacterium]
MDLYHQRTGAVYHLTDLDRLRGTAPTKLILLAEPEERERLHSRFSRELEGRAAVTRSEPEYLEIMAPGISKGAALPAIARHLGIATEQILAVGDADNDNEMLEAAGIGVAVANAREETRRIADFVTESSNNDGAVAEAIRRFALGGNTS